MNRDELKTYLEKCFETMGHPKADRLFELAWEHGHANGEWEVGIYYQEFMELLAPKTVHVLVEYFRARTEIKAVFKNEKDAKAAKRKLEKENEKEYEISYLIIPRELK